MASSVKVAPSILSADFGRLADEVSSITKAGADYVHVDVMDGHFVPNLTIGPIVVAAVRRATALPLDVHLMIANPDRYIEAFASAGADIIGVHVEATPHLHRVIQQIRATGKRVSVTLNPATPIESLDDVLADIDQVLVMSVNPGFGGQQFIPRALHRVEALAKRRFERGLSFEIEVDGGVNVGNAGALVGAGADVLVAGTAVFGEQDYARAIAALRA